MHTVSKFVFPKKLRLSVVCVKFVVSASFVVEVALSAHIYQETVIVNYMRGHSPSNSMCVNVIFIIM